MSRIASALLICAGSALAQAPCANWSQDFRTPGTDSSGLVVCSVTFDDDGGGADLYVGGRFGVLGGSASRSIARWDGAQWSAVGDGLDDSNPQNSGVQSFAIHDEGSGPRLFAAGNFTRSGATALLNVARWDGLAWSPVGAGLNSPPTALATYDDGGGAKLYAVAASALFVWDGATWQLLPGFLTAASLLVWNDGGGSALYVGVNGGVRRYDGTSITQLVGGIAGTVRAMATYDDGSGTKLHGIMAFPQAAGVVRWDGSAWSTPAVPVTNANSLANIDLGDGQGSKLYVSGDFTNAGGVGANKVARMHGSAWEAYAPATTITTAYFTTLYQGTLFVASSIRSNTEFRADGLLRLQGSAWAPVASGNGLVDGLSHYTTTYALEEYDAGSGPELFVGGSFLDAAPSTVRARAAHYDGARWETSSVPQTTSDTRSISDFAVLDLGSGPRLYANFAGLQRYEGGTTWTAMPNSASISIWEMITFDDGTGPKIYAGGQGGTPSGPPPWPDPFAIVSVWNGTQWSTVGTSADMLGAHIGAFAIHDDGGGASLYAGGIFPNLGASQSPRITRRSGNGWSAVGAGIDDGAVAALASFDDGSGAKLYAGGTFTNVGGGVPAHGIACWDGIAWSAVGAAGAGNVQVNALAVHDDGTGPALYAAGRFTSIGGVAAANIARWDGTQWTTLGLGVNGRIEDLQSFDDRRGDGPALYACGPFTLAGGGPSARIAKWGCSNDAGFTYCFGDASSATPCPCGNAGATGHGCANSFASSGARLVATGSTSLDLATGTDTIVLRASGLPSSTTVLFLKGSAAITPGTVFGDGLRCVGGTQIRLATVMASAGAAQYPRASDPSLSVRGATPIGSGSTGYYQAYYRNLASFCTSATFNLSNGVALTWGY